MKIVLQEADKSTTLGAIIRDFENQGGNFPENNAITIKGIIYKLKMYSHIELEQLMNAYNAGLSQPKERYKFWNEYHKENYN